MTSLRARLLKSPRTWMITGFAVALALVVRVSWIWMSNPTADQRGVLAAQRDHESGRYIVMWFGKPDERHREYQQVLDQKYGVRLMHCGGCVIPSEKHSYAKGYNATTEKVLREKYGKDIFEECYALAGELYKAKRRFQEQQKE